MADQLLSQADVDALVASLAKSELPAPIKNKTAPIKAASIKPVHVSASLKSSNMSFVKASSGPNNQNIPSKVAQVVSKAGSVARQNPTKTITSPRQEPKSVASTGMVNTLNTKIADLTERLNQMGSSLKRLEILEERISDLEGNLAKNKELSNTIQKFQQLDQDLKQVTANLKATPAYGVHNTFTCEKCDDHGHVATLFRCTKCGHERWYGWWSKK